MARTKDADDSGTPLPKKLGIKPRTTVLLVGAPRGWEPTLGELPDDVVIRRGAIAKADMILWFVSSTKELRAGARKAARAFTGGLWIAWPKKASGVPTDLSEDVGRTTGIAAGLVDFRCARSTRRGPDTASRGVPEVQREASARWPRSESTAKSAPRFQSVTSA
jgi:hypothetical protein